MQLSILTLSAAILLLACTGTSAASSSNGLSGVWVLPNQRTLDEDSPLKLMDPEPPPLNDKWRPIYEEGERQRKLAEARGEPPINDRTLCYPDGVPKMMSTTFPLEILETPGKVTMIAEFNTQVRHIHMDQSHPPEDELEYNFFGHSTGRWEGRSLVIDTVGLRDSTELFQRVPHSEQLRVVERLTLDGPDLLRVSITMIDPVVFTKPWTVERIFERREDVELREFVCVENNRHYADPAGTIEAQKSCR